MEIIPAIDLIDGKVVRLTGGDYQKMTSYGPEPLEMARRFEDAGITRLHIVDLDGAKKGEVVNWKVLESVCSGTRLQVDFGGGVKKAEDVERILDCGARWVTIGSMAVKQPEVFRDWMLTYGAGSFFLGADVRERAIAVSGWLETSSRDVHEFIDHYTSAGLHYVFCTDISKDGMLTGPSTALYKEIMEKNPRVRLVASGGVSSVDDLEKLEAVGCHGVIIGKAIYENRISLEELKKYIR